MTTLHWIVAGAIVAMAGLLVIVGYAACMAGGDMDERMGYDDGTYGE